MIFVLNFWFISSKTFLIKIALFNSFVEFPPLWIPTTFKFFDKINGPPEEPLSVEILCQINPSLLNSSIFPSDNDTSFPSGHWYIANNSL